MTATITGQNFVISDESLTVSESVGIYECDFTFDESWNGWQKTAVFQGSGETIEVIIVDGKAQIPWEVLKENGWMRVGVYGTRNAHVKPTIWSGDIYVSRGTTPGSIETEPTPSTYAQILELANSAKETAEDVAEDWASVTAEASTLAAGSPASASFANNKFTFGIPQGPKGDTGATGAPGATPAFSIGTVTTLETGQPASASVTGTAAQPVLNLGLPKGNKGDNGDVANTAPAYSTSATYAVGDYCIYNSQLYRCTTAITTAEAWTAAHWTAVQLGGDVSTLRSALNALFNDDLIPVFKFDTLGSGTPYLPLPKYFSTEKKYAICFNPSETATFTKVGLSTGTAASTIVVMLGVNVEMTSNVPCWFNNVGWADTAKYIYFAGHNFKGTIVIYEQDNFVKKDADNNVSVRNTDFVEKDNPDLLANAVPIGNIFYNNSNGTASYLNGFYSYEVSISEGLSNVYPYNEFGASGDRYIRSICFYDGTGTFISGVSGSNNNVIYGVSVPSNARLIKASLHYASVDGRSVIAPHFLSTRRGNQTIKQLDPQISQTDNNIRISCINFQFDDGVAKDADIVTIFNTAKLKCGFALISNISATDALRYKGYQDNGFEILSHADSGTGMNDTSVTLATNETRLKNSKEILETYGFVINGFVTPNSTMADMFKPILRKYYQWAETVYLGEYTGSETPYMTPLNGAYNGFRVSLQSTTLANQKAAVDECIANYGCLTFYGHAASLDTTDNLTTENLTELLAYINQKVANGECKCDIPSNCIRDYFNVRNDDISDGWVSVTATEAELDSRFTVNYWSMYYNKKLKLLTFAIRVAPSENVSGQIGALFKFPVKVMANTLVQSETGRNCLVYNNALLIQGSNIWSQGDNMRFSAMIKMS